jgi:hypothetical protein
MDRIRKNSAKTVDIFSSFSYKNIPKIFKNFISGGEDVYDQAVSSLGPETRNIHAETEMFPSSARISFRVQNLLRKRDWQHRHRAEARNISAEKRTISEQVRTSIKRPETYLQRPETSL